MIRPTLVNDEFLDLIFINATQQGIMKLSVDQNVINNHHGTAVTYLDDDAVHLLQNNLRKNVDGVSWGEGGGAFQGA